MDMKKLLATIAQQIEIAKLHAELERPRGGLDPILRSLRVTYVALSSGLDPWRDALHLFVLSVGPTGEHELLQGGQPVPVNAPYLSYLFWTAGVELLPGQIVLLEPELAKDAIEDALGVLALGLALIERERQARRSDPEALRTLELRARRLLDRKSDLISASLVAEEFLERAA